MTTRATERAAPDSANGARAPRPGARQLLVRFLTLREGSIVVVTVLAIIYFAVDAGSTQGLAQTIQKQKLRDKGVKGGGYDLTPVTQKLLAGDQIDFTIDQQPYLQGFLPVLQLYMNKVSNTLSGIADVNTGLKFLDKTTVVPYNSTKSRYEGTSSQAGVVKA